MDVDHLGDNVPQGISVNGPVREASNDSARPKRKASKPTIKEDSGSDSDAPLVSIADHTRCHSVTDGVSRPNVDGLPMALRKLRQRNLQTTT
jgi:hypothetical protein